MPFKYIAIGVGVIVLLFGIYQSRVAIQGWVDDYISKVSEAAVKEEALKVSSAANQDLIDRMNAVTKGLKETEEKVATLQTKYANSQAVIVRLQGRLQQLDVKGLANANPSNLGDKLTADTNGTIGLLRQEGRISDVLRPGKDRPGSDPAPAPASGPPTAVNAGQVGRPYSRRRRGNGTPAGCQPRRKHPPLLRQASRQDLPPVGYYRGAIQGTRGQ
jgi:hypothetical protein